MIHQSGCAFPVPPGDICGFGIFPHLRLAEVADQTAAMNDEVAARFTRLELSVAHLEHLTEQLNGVVIAQGRQLQDLRKQFQRQSQTLETMELERVKSTNPKPPHYQ